MSQNNGLMSSSRDETALLRKVKAKMKDMDTMMDPEVNPNTDDTKLCCEVKAKMKDMDTMMERMRKEHTKSTSELEEDLLRIDDRFEMNTAFDDGETMKEHKITPGFKKLDRNIFSMMIVAEASSLAWWYTICVFIFK